MVKPSENMLSAVNPGDTRLESSPGDGMSLRAKSMDTPPLEAGSGLRSHVSSSSSGSGSGSEFSSPRVQSISSPERETAPASADIVSVPAPDGSEATDGIAPKKQIVMMKRSADDFIFEKVLGEGSFSTVFLARDIHSSKQYAIKVCEKAHIRREKKETYIKREKEIMNVLGQHPCPFFVQLFFAFHDSQRLYFVITYARNGEILPYLHKVGCFDADCTRFYSGEIVLALEHLEKLGIVHRDLKPENILLNEQMHILITDFGSAKMDSLPEIPVKSEIVPTNSDEEAPPGMRPRRNSFVGTADYVSPEILTNKDTTNSADLWALGCLIYQLLAGLPPFRAPNEYLIFQKILKLEYCFPDGFNTVAKGLVTMLLDKDPTKRLGCKETGGFPALKGHEFFKGLTWEKLHLQKPPPITPYLPASSDHDELRSDFVISPNVRPGFDEQQLSRLLDLQLKDGAAKATEPRSPATSVSMKGSILDISPEDYAQSLAVQARDNPWHRFVDNHLIIKQGFIEKRKGLFARRRMFLLTTGPHFYYVDPVAMVLKGEIPWSADMKPEPKNFKTFFVHTPNRTYYLEDPQGYALEWCKVLEEVRSATFDKKELAQKT